MTDDDKCKDAKSRSGQQVVRVQWLMIETNVLVSSLASHPEHVMERWILSIARASNDTFESLTSLSLPLYALTGG